MLDKSAFDIIGLYYTKPPSSQFLPGLVSDSVTYHLPPVLDFLKFDVDAANRGDPIAYSIGSSDSKTFDHTPVVRPRPLRRHEAFVVATAKRRPGVILSSPLVRPVGAPKQDFPDTYLIAPLFSFNDNHENEFRLRVEAWEYSHLFFMPEDPGLGIERGFLRFDRCQVIPAGLLRARTVAMTENAFLALRYYFEWFLTGKIDATFASYRSSLLELVAKTLRS
jgi:hypothetical protein